MIRYPELNKLHAGITAPSSGVGKERHPIMYQAIERMAERGFKTTVGDTVWTQEKSKSADKITRAKELNKMLQDDSIDLIFPPWGGELLIEILEYIEFDKMTLKWILGYSDISALLLAVTLKTGIATAHGTNIIDIRGPKSDATTVRWLDVLQTKVRESIEQQSSELYQLEWIFDSPNDEIFNLTEPTKWKSVTEKPVEISGRLLGGCTDVIHHLVGTPYGDVKGFINNQNIKENIIWYFENCEDSPTDLKRVLTQMKYAGWFEQCSGILFGRTAVTEDVDGYTFLDVYSEIQKDLGIPVIYDVDCGHVPPQMTFVNGAMAHITYANNAGTMTQNFLP
ncbi:MAG TPA: LD-carboxypeptidase [Aliicoccus persicus]|uniref:LD-carboxypeptidase n=1 Tax=Aliicoccus persicus TaxID=930138 RepID=A0A921JCN0_9STAP|nr:LD-carboxypeptidase [Aliicoccus persicus]